MAGFVAALVLLPNPGSKLEMKWQGPFTVTRALEDGLNCELDTGKTCKQPGRGGGYCHIWAIKVCAAVKGMVFKQFSLV